MQKEPDKFDQALTLINTTKVNVFLTGKAGTGKTTFLNRLNNECLKLPYVTVAPTGVAAVNAHGVTIYSVFKLPFKPFLPGAREKLGPINSYNEEILKGIKMLVIDEVSMIRADMLDAVDCRLREVRQNSEPFGGVQLLMVGDLCQLPPVTKPEEQKELQGYYNSMFFFESHALKKCGFVTIELTKVFRQDNKEFQNILNAVRNGYLPDSMLNKLNERYIPNFKPNNSEYYIRLVTHNKQVEQINKEEMGKIGGWKSEYEAQIEGYFPESYYPVDHTLVLKEGVRVMFCKSKPGKYYNGSLGVVTSTLPVKVRLDGKQEEITVEPAEWENVEYKLVKPKNDGEPRLEKTVVGTFTQLPLRLAWAIIIHKSQGLTFDRAIIDTHLAFSSGQTYVALSRCRSLEGIVLAEKVTWQSIKSDKAAIDFYKTGMKEFPSQDELAEMQMDTYIDYLEKIFDITKEKEWFDAWLEYVEDIIEAPIIDTCEITKDLKSRIRKTSDYYSDRQIQENIKSACRTLLAKLLDWGTISGQEVEYMSSHYEYSYCRERDERKLSLFNTANQFHCALLSYVIQHGYNLKAIQRIYHNIDFPKTFISETVVSKPKIPDGVQYYKLYNSLMKWRHQKAKEEGVQTWQILYDCCIEELTTLGPLSLNDLEKIESISQNKRMKYGNELLDIVKSNQA